MRAEELRLEREEIGNHVLLRRLELSDQAVEVLGRVLDVGPARSPVRGAAGRDGTAVTIDAADGAEEKAEAREQAANPDIRQSHDKTLQNGVA